MHLFAMCNAGAFLRLAALIPQPDFLSISIPKPKPLRVIRGPASEGYPELLHFLFQVGINIWKWHEMAIGEAQSTNPETRDNSAS